MTGEDILPYVEERCPSFDPSGVPDRLPGGNLNRVWRVPGAEQSVIVKHAPPHVASNPEIPLDPFRLVIEARCLQAFGLEGELRSLPTDAVRPPRLIDMNRQKAVLIMEDVGKGPTLDRWFSGVEDPSGVSAASSWGHHLGRFIGRLHSVTANESSYAERFDNRPMQETRQDVQYEGVSDMLDRAGVSDGDALAAKAEALGERLLEPGVCLTMGDLWPPSVMVEPQGLRVIDWELAHYGRPLQDVAHWLAHLWMQEHVADTSASVTAIAEHRRSFVTAYQASVTPVQDELWSAREKRGAAIHFGAEILMRAVGPFQDGYVYSGLDLDHPRVREAVETAVHHLRTPDEGSVLES